jgi:hypothetical protein
MGTSTRDLQYGFSSYRFGIIAKGLGYIKKSKARILMLATMAKANVTLSLATAAGSTIDDRMELRFSPLPNSSGGLRMKVPEFRFLGVPSLRVTGIQCSDIGTLYAVEIRSRRHQVDAFHIRVLPGEMEPVSRTLMVDPTKVLAIDVPPYESLDPQLQAILEASDLEEFRDPDDPAKPLQGRQLYQALPHLKLACLLNLAAKASHTSSAAVWSMVRGLRRLEQDRVFALVDDRCFPFVSGNRELYEEAPGLLHEPLEEFDRRQSFKTRSDRTAGLQLSFMQHKASGQWAADIDIDEAGGFHHTFELIRNVFRGLTNPYQVRELLLLNARELDPGYTLIFDA